MGAVNDPNAPAFAMVAPRANIQQNAVTYRANSTQIIDLQRTGYMAGLSGILYINLTTPAAGAITANALGPEALIRQIELKTANGVTFHRTSGKGLYYVNRRRNTLDYKSPWSLFTSSTRWASVYNHPAAPGNSATITLAVPIDIRNVVGERDLGSLILLEGRSTVQLAITWGDAATDPYTFANPPTINSVSFAPEADVFLLPDGAYQAPAVSPTLQTIEESRACDNQTFKWYPRNRGALLSAIFWFESAAGVQKATTYVSSYNINFGNVQTPISGLIPAKDYVDARESDGLIYPEGVHVFDFLTGNGDSKRMPSMRDVIRIADGEDVYFQFNLAAAPAAGDRMFVVTEMLKPANML